ncbi:hypothetical protein S7S_11140 [Isoalcanivorax pacificus W11-5]|uniref:Uncharacterized protein n=2 Tax=Isoalcanivorax TaxID=3020833 RepID=A0A0B4XPG5_9GAMM|nr:hypothetical protein S7S_11140 [Isoalcanivorax pacificus W11-5]
MYRGSRGRAIRLCCVVMATLLSGNAALASLLGAGMFVATPEVTPVISQGYVMARAQVVGPNGGPILIKARTQGNAVTAETTEVEEIGEVVAGGHLDGSYILSGDEYREVLSRWATLRATQPELASRAEFITRDMLAQGLKLANGDISEPLTLPTHIHTVVVLGEEDRFGKDTRRHVLIAAPFLFDRDTALEDSVSSLLMGADGNIIDTAQGSGVGSGDFDVEVFTYRTAFYAEPGATEQSEQRLQEGDDIFGPVANATIEQLGWYGPSYALTGSDGRYNVNAPMLCMRTGWGYYLVPGIEFPLTLTVPTVPFNPNRLGIPPYYELRTVYAACGDAGYRPNRFDFLIDVLWLVGEMHLANTPGGAPIPVGDTVTYEGENREGDPTTQEWDFDGDGENDTVLLADKVTETDDETGMDYTVPQENEEGAWQAVYFSSGSRSPEAETLAERVPDLWRLADRSLDQRATGILTGISEDALRHTDVYIFRESTGELLVEVSGLPEGPYAGRASRVENNRYLWHTLLRGAESRRNSYAAYGQSGITGAPDEEKFSAESEELGFSSRYQAREVDLPAPGESLHIVAINRVTGYTGSLRFELGRPGAGDGAARQEVPELELLPPNVKVWAQRLTEIEAGLTQGEEREYLISHEGAATSSDIIVGLYTEWLAPDGSPMPAALGTNRGEDYGLTGRLAKVVDGNLVAVSAGQAVEDSTSLDEALTAGSAGSAGNVAEFGIGPGRQLQLLRLPEFGQGNEHYYLNLFGRALNKEVCSHCQYDQSGAHPTLAGRPNHFAPLYVPRYDEATTLALRAEARKLAEENEEEMAEIDPQYAWVVRPEYRFSQIDFKVDELEAIRTDEEGNEVSRNLLDSPNPVIASGDDLIRALYGLVLPGSDPLAGFDGEREFVLAVGEEEITIPAGGELPAELGNLEHLSSLDAQDFLSIRLYMSHDPENVLWEWAFWHLAVGVEEDSDLVSSQAVYVYADNPEINLYAVLMGYTALLEDQRDKAPQFIEWRVVEGDAQLSQSRVVLDEHGASQVTVTLAPHTDNRVRVEALLEGDDASTVSSMDLVVIAGKPALIVSTITGRAYSKRAGSATVEAIVYDQYGNLVEDGSPIMFREEGHIDLLSYQGFTQDGRATALVTGGSVSGNFDLQISAGEADSSISVPVSALSVSLLNTPGQAVAGERYELQAKVGGGPGAHGGIFVDIGSSGGTIEAMDPQTNAEGVVNFTWRAPEIPGTYQIAARLHLNDPQVTTVAVESRTADSVEQDHYVLVDTGVAGNASVTTFTGAQAQVIYPVDPVVTLRGTPGDDYAVVFDSYHLPNREPVILTRFQDFPYDQTRTYRTTTRGVALASSPYPGFQALSFNTPTAAAPHSEWDLLGFDGVAVAQPSYNFWINPDAPGRVLDVGGGAFVLVLEEGRLDLKAKIGDESVVLQGPSIQMGQWQSVSAGYRDGELYVAVDAEILSVVVAGALRNPVEEDARWLTLGSGFGGKIAGFRLYDWESPALLALQSPQGTYNSEGIAHVSLSATSYLQQNPIQLPSVSVGLRTDNDIHIHHNVLSRSVYDRLAATYAGVLDENIVAPSQLASMLPMESLFPDPRVAVTQLAHRFSSESAYNNARENVAGAIAWLSFSPRYQSLQSNTELMQSYFATHNDGDLAIYALDYLQQAVLQANQGEELLLQALVTGLVVWSELEEVRPDLAEIVGQAISNRRDFWTWIRVLSLPANGWATEGIPMPRYDVTCDQVPATVNVGTPLAWNPTPCRATGWQMAAFLDEFLAVDQDIYQEPELLSVYVITLLSGLKTAPTELKKLFPNMVPTGVGANEWQFSLLPQAHAAGPLVYGLRALMVVLRQAVRKAGGAAPANFIAFMQGGTTSRVTPAEMLPAVAYLMSRLEMADCDSCAKLEPQVSETVQADIAAWFVGMGLAVNGEIEDENERDRKCTITNRTHGKAFEILVTGAYHALYEFGGALGIENPDQYEILYSDPRSGENKIKVAMMKENRRGELVRHGHPFYRKPDLVLAGEGNQKRYWIEVKSWMYRNPSRFTHWDGRQTRGLDFRQAAHRQHFYDFVASRDALREDYWDVEYKNDPDMQIKPARHRLWFQMWKAERRTWRKLKKTPNGRYRLSEETETKNVATPWIDAPSPLQPLGATDDRLGRFAELQEFILQRPLNIDAVAFKHSTGMNAEEYRRYILRQSGQGLAKWRDSTVAPFSLGTFFAIEAGDAGRDLTKRLMDELGGNDFADLQKALSDGEFSQEQIEEFRVLIGDQIDELLGPLEYLFFEIPLISRAENAAADWVLGEEVEALQEWVADVSLPTWLMENLCEVQ